ARAGLLAGVDDAREERGGEGEATDSDVVPLALEAEHAAVRRGGDVDAATPRSDRAMAGQGGREDQVELGFGRDVRALRRAQDGRCSDGGGGRGTDAELAVSGAQRLDVDREFARDPTVGALELGARRDDLGGKTF